MKKAAIITFHCVPNYGAVLQAYALQKKLMEYFDEVAIVDYTPKSITKEYNVISWHSIPSVIVTSWASRQFISKKRKFASFMKNEYNLAKCYYDSGTLKSDYGADVIFLGSDQIWNPQITGGFDSVFFGEIHLPNKPIKASYAASIGKNELTEKENESFSWLVNYLDFISVREKYLREIVSHNCLKPAEIVADPTILAGREVFLPLIKPVKYEQYLLFYSLNGMPEAVEMAKKIANYFDLTLIELSGRRKTLIKKKHEAIYNAGPNEFVSLFANANYIVTDSFHGTVFSLLFHKPFVSLANIQRGGRITGLLESVGLSERCIMRFDRDVVCTNPNWEEIDKKLAEIRKKSEQYIASVMEAIQ